MHNSKNIQLDGYSLISQIILVILKELVFASTLKEFLSVKIINLSARNECIFCEVSIENCNDFIAVMYRSPSQINDQFENSSSSLEDLI